MQSDEIRSAAERLIADERQRIADLVDAYWTFDHQQPAASWHEKQACLDAIKSGEIPFEQLKHLKSRKAIAASKTKMLDAMLSLIDLAQLRDAAADGDLPVDEAWLNQSGEWEYENLGDECPYEIFRHKKTNLEIWDCNGDKWIVDAFDQAGVKPNAIKTRDQLRRLVGCIEALQPLPAAPKAGE